MLDAPPDRVRAAPKLVDPLAVEALHVDYAGVPALRGIHLAVAPGEFVALLGPSGCGKTSLLRTVAGFVAPRAGAIRLAGRDVARLPARARNIGLVFQSYALFPHMTVAANVRFGLECRGVSGPAADRRVADALALVGMDAMAARRPGQLSGGQQQRVALARAVVIEPDLLLLDEPLGALDRQLRTRMQTELRALQRRLGIAALFVTHDQEESMGMADRVAVMRSGRIAQVATPEALFAHPADAWVADFMGAGTLLRGPMERTAGGWRLPLGAGAALEADGPVGGALFVPAGCVRLRPDPGGLPVIGRRFMGLGVEVTIGTSAGPLAAVLTPEDAGPFHPGAHALPETVPGACRLLPEGDAS